MNLCFNVLNCLHVCNNNNIEGKFYPEFSISWALNLFEYLWIFSHLNYEEGLCLQNVEDLILER